MNFVVRNNWSVFYLIVQICNFSYFTLTCDTSAAVSADSFSALMGKIRDQLEHGSTSYFYEMTSP